MPVLNKPNRPASGMKIVKGKSTLGSSKRFGFKGASAKGARVIKANKKRSAAGYQTQKVKRLKFAMIALRVLIVVVILTGLFFATKEYFKQSALPEDSTVSSAVSSSSALPVYDNSVSLLLANLTTPLADSVNIQLAAVGSAQVDKRIVESLTALMKAAEKDGVKLKVTEGYIDKNKQQQMYQDKVNELVSQGQTQLTAEENAKKQIPPGGCSDHQTGLAVHFAPDAAQAPDDFTLTDAYKWLTKHSVEYGFVLRYPPDKKTKTGMDEPAHFRYVGVENALKMREMNMCLEEYVQYVSKQPKQPKQ